MFCGKFIRSLLSSGTYCRQLESLILPSAGYYPVGYVVGADHTESDAHITYVI
jgi:hypothetical protein